jgi:type VI secretion system secreted protein VgrG
MAISMSGPHKVLSLKVVAGGEDAFLVLRFRGNEQMNRLGEFKVDVVGALVPVVDQPVPIVPSMLMGTKAVIKMDVHDDKRGFVGYITRFDQGEKHGRFYSYTFTLKPWLWFATRGRNSRVFQKKNVKEIVTEVLTPYLAGNTMKWDLVAESLYPKLDFCVQYDESDYDFASRLLQRAGINYYFKHDGDAEKLELVLFDSNAKLTGRGPMEPIHWASSLKDEGTITDWTSSDEVRFKAAVVKDYDYLAPATAIEKEKKDMLAMPLWKGPGEFYEYPGDVVQNSQLETAGTTVQKAATDKAAALFESLQQMRRTATARCNARDIAVGLTFPLKSHPMNQPKQDGDYAVVAANYSAEFAQHEAIRELAALSRSKEGFVAQILVTDKADNIRPDMTVVKPMMRGPQTAVVVGASGNEIETDKHGRVKVKFHWDRDTKKDQTSSCWVRVATPWASKNFGMISIPRVGDEVVVDFIDGDPDKPLVVGSVYNELNPPIWELPANATMSGIKSRTSKKGDFETSNELRFEDKKEKEHIWIQAERDFYRHVKKKAFDFVGDESMAKKKKSHKESIVENWFLDVGKDVQHNFGKDVHLTVAGDIFYKGGATWQVELAKDMTVKVGGAFGYQVTGDSGLKSTGKLLLTSAAEAHLKGTSKVAIEGAQVSIKASGGVVLDCPGGITLKCGGSLVSLTSAGVDIVGGVVKLNSGGGGPGGSAATEAKDASPAKPAKLEDITSAKATDYDKNFENPYKKSQ